MFSKGLSEGLFQALKKPPNFGEEGTDFIFLYFLFGYFCFFWIRMHHDLSLAVSDGEVELHSVVPPE
jgi:hypothetical protein